MNLEESNVGVILLDNVDKVTENMTARRTGEIASLPVGEGLLGRVINTLGEPIDGAGPIQGSYRPWTERVDHRRPSNRENGYRHRYDYQSTR